jgi:hypothetical protein
MIARLVLLEAQRVPSALSPRSATTLEREAKPAHTSICRAWTSCRGEYILSAAPAIPLSDIARAVRRSQTRRPEF